MATEQIVTKDSSEQEALWVTESHGILYTSTTEQKIAEFKKLAAAFEEAKQTYSPGAAQWAWKAVFLSS